mgnify:CR=1 FL=1
MHLFQCSQKAQLKIENIETDPNLDIIALIAYLQRLGTDIKVTTEQTAQNN